MFLPSVLWIWLSLEGLRLTGQRLQAFLFSLFLQGSLIESRAGVGVRGSKKEAHLLLERVLSIRIEELIALNRAQGYLVLL